MDLLKLAALATALAVATPACAETVADWRLYVAEASQRFGVPVAWIERVMAAESGGRTQRNGRPVTSRAGAMGLMQVMPDTWAAMRATYGLGSDPFDPRDNIIAGTAYLRLMYDRFGYPGLFAAYNAGPGRYADYLAGRRGLPGETRVYVATIAGRGAVAGARGERVPPTLFIPLATATIAERGARDTALTARETAPATTTTPDNPGLFAILRSR